MQDESSHSRRFSARVNTKEGVWVHWSCEGRDDVSRVHDLSVGGLFLETHERKSVGSKVAIHFLVQEGQIRAEAVVRHTDPGRGLGLKFTAVRGEDRPHLEGLVRRCRQFSAAQGRAGQV